MDRTRRFKLGDEPVLSEGDLVRFEIVGVHPDGPQERLRYRLYGGRLGGLSDIPDSGWVEGSEFHVSIPRQRSVEFRLSVADVDDLANGRVWGCSCRVRPAGAG
jgi:hypothetical protein